MTSAIKRSLKASLICTDLVVTNLICATIAKPDTVSLDSIVIASVMLARKLNGEIFQVFCVN